jgi:hypothetical protein
MFLRDYRFRFNFLYCKFLVKIELFEYNKFKKSVLICVICVEKNQTLIPLINSSKEVFFSRANGNDLLLLIIKKLPSFLLYFSI